MPIKNDAPKNLSELSNALAGLTPESKIISGGTDLIIRLNQGVCVPDVLLYMGEIDGIRDISETEDSIEIGAMATMTAIADCEALAGPYAALRHSAADVGAVQIRNSATIGGNFANASPAGDLAPALYLLNAEVVIARADGTFLREPVDKVLVGPGKTTLQYNDAIVKFIIPKASSKTAKSAFVKLGFRRQLTISRIGLAVMLDVGEDEAIMSAKVIAGAISLTPVHVEKAEQYLIGKKPDLEAARETGKLLSDLIMEITPEMFDRDYKVSAAYGVAEDVFAKLGK